MSKRKFEENPKDGKRGKITNFLIPKEQTEIGSSPRPVRSAVRSHNVKLVGLFEITSSRGGFQACDYSSGLIRNTKF